MKKLLIISTLLLASTTTFAGPRCTDGDQSNWIPAGKMQEDILAQGYKIKKFKVTSGGCYEIYGWDQADNKVEVYFHPVSGEAVKVKRKD